MNVAITRAKKKLVIIGTVKYLQEVKPWDRIVSKIQEEGWQINVDSDFEQECLRVKMCQDLFE
jgi:superfamily I DNA and/or RNA helicase